MVAARLFRSYGGHHEDPSGCLATKQRMQPLEGVLVAPLQIVDHQQKRLSSLGERRVQRLIEMMPLPAFRQWTRPLDGSMLRQDFRQHARQIRQLRLRHLRAGRGQRLGAKPLGDRRVCQLALRRITARPSHGLLAARTPFDTIPPPDAICRYPARRGAAPFVPVRRIARRQQSISCSHSSRRPTRGPSSDNAAACSRVFDWRTLRQPTSARCRTGRGSPGMGPRRVPAAGSACTGDRRAMRWPDRDWRRAGE